MLPEAAYSDIVGLPVVQLVRGAGAVRLHLTPLCALDGTHYLCVPARVREEGCDDAAHHGGDAQDRRDDAARLACCGGVSVLTRFGRRGHSRRTHLVWPRVSVLILTGHIVGCVQVRACILRGSFETYHVTRYNSGFAMFTLTIVIVC